MTPEPIISEFHELTLHLEEDCNEATQPQSKLMSLPIEIRNQIWHECLSGLTFQIDENNGVYEQARFRAHRGLLTIPLSCRQA